MSKLEYLNPSDWSLHVINGENEGVPGGWVLVPSGADKLIQAEDGIKTFWINGKQYHLDGTLTGHGKDGLLFSDWCSMWDYKLLWTRKMKEYLVECDGKYELIEAYHLDGGIEVPEGAFVLKFFKDPLVDFCFYKENYTYIWQNHEKPKYWDKLTIDQSKVVSDSGVILWQRKPSLNDQFAEIEKVCQDSNVSNPKHYTSHPSGIECIEITRHHDFAIGNAIKYLWRAGLKDSDNEIQDLEKAAWYIQDKIKQLKGGK